MSRRRRVSRRRRSQARENPIGIAIALAAAAVAAIGTVAYVATRKPTTAGSKTPTPANTPLPPTFNATQVSAIAAATTARAVWLQYNPNDNVPGPDNIGAHVTLVGAWVEDVVASAASQGQSTTDAANTALALVKQTAPQGYAAFVSAVAAYNTNYNVNGLNPPAGGGGNDISANGNISVNVTGAQNAYNQAQNAYNQAQSAAQQGQSALDAISHIGGSVTASGSVG